MKRILFYCTCLFLTLHPNLSAQETEPEYQQPPLKLRHISESRHRPRTLVSSSWLECHYGNGLMYFVSCDSEILYNLEITITNVDTGFFYVYYLPESATSLNVHLSVGTYHVYCRVDGESYEGVLSISS